MPASLPQAGYFRDRRSGDDWATTVGGVAGLCLLAAGVIVCYGLYLIIT